MLFRAATVVADRISVNKRLCHGVQGTGGKTRQSCCWAPERRLRPSTMISRLPPTPQRCGGMISV